MPRQNNWELTHGEILTQTEISLQNLGGGRVDGRGGLGYDDGQGEDGGGGPVDGGELGGDDDGGGQDLFADDGV